MRKIFLLNSLGGHRWRRTIQSFTDGSFELLVRRQLYLRGNARCVSAVEHWGSQLRLLKACASLSPKKTLIVAWPTTFVDDKAPA